MIQHQRGALSSALNFRTSTHLDVHPWLQRAHVKSLRDEIEERAKRFICLRSHVSGEQKKPIHRRVHEEPDTRRDEETDTSKTKVDTQRRSRVKKSQHPADREGTSAAALYVTSSVQQTEEDRERQPPTPKSLQTQTRNCIQEKSILEGPLLNLPGHALEKFR